MPSQILHGYETYSLMELNEQKPFVVPPNVKNRGQLCLLILSLDGFFGLRSD